MLEKTVNRNPRMKNIIWIVIDTLRSDMLASCLSPKAVPNEIDDVMEQGYLFTDVMTTGGSTRNSAPAYFSAMRPGLTGMASSSVQSIRYFKDDVLTVTEHFKHHGYRTFRWSDSSLDSCQPKRGFDVFEAGYPNINLTPDKSYDNEKRNNFINMVRKSTKPFFAYFHLYYIHDFGGKKKSSWTTDDYLYIISQQAKDFKSLWDKVAPGQNDIAVVTSDHGCILNENYVEYDKVKPWRFANNKTRVPASFIAEGLTPQKNHDLIRSIDIAPTLLDLAVGGEMKAQGVSLKSTLLGGPTPELIGIAERNHYQNFDIITDFACVRKKDWALYLDKGVPKALYDYSEGEFATDHLGDGLKIEHELNEFYRQTAIDGPKTAQKLYEQNGLSIDEIRGNIEVSILLPVFNWSEDSRLAIEALLDQLLLTELILLDADESGETAEMLKEKYSDRLLLNYINAKGMNLQQMLNLGLDQAKGAYTVTATPNSQYTENFCYSLREHFLENSATVLSYPNMKRMIADRRDMEYIGSDSCFDEIMFSRLGSLFDHKAGTAAISLPQFNEIGACAMFETETLRSEGGFSESVNDVLGKTWFKLNKKGKVSHVNKGLVISKEKNTLRPRMPESPRGEKLKISILVPMESIAEHRKLPVFLNMISKQTEKSFEIILLNSSEQNDLITAVSRDFPELKIKLLSPQKNISELYNTGLFASQGEFLFWADISDKLLPHTLSELLKKIEEEDDAIAIKCGHVLYGAENTAQEVKPLAQAREMICEICDLRGLLYKRRLHNEVGTFRSTAEQEMGWDMCVRLGLVRSFKVIEEPLVIAQKPYQFTMNPDITSYHRILRSTINSMGNTIDLVRLYEDDFRRHQADRARYILEDEMMVTLELINKSGINSAALLRVPKTHYIN